VTLQISILYRMTLRETTAANSRGRARVGIAGHTQATDSKPKLRRPIPGESVLIEE
jgi:hypothetical protein